MATERTQPNTAQARITRCPQCGKSARATQDNSHRPFCSKRCKMLDLGDWLDETNRIAGEPDMDAASSARLENV